MDATKTLDTFLDLVKSRDGSLEQFGYGITTADRYVRQIRMCAGNEACASMLTSEVAGATSWSDMIKRAEQRPVYCNEDMTIDGNKIVTNSSDFQKIVGPEIELPTNTLMVFRNFITTPRRDRDGDILETGGARPDEKMPLLWQHLHEFPIGRMVNIVTHDANQLLVNSAIIDSPLGNDTAQLIEFEALRISHGFLPLEWENLDQKDAGDHPFPGFRITSFEIMEESTVSVPSNVDAVITNFSRAKFTSGIVKGWAKHFYDNRPTLVQSGLNLDDKGGKCACGSGDSPAGQLAPDETSSSSASGHSSSTTSTPSTDEANADGKPKSVLGHVVTALSGSYEQRQHDLEKSGLAWLSENRVPVGDDDWASLVATFDNEAVICWIGARRPFSQDICYRGSWTEEDGKAVWQGEPVEVEVTADVEERAAELAALRKHDTAFQRAAEELVICLRS